jgi:phage terminase large subunit-like protein
MKFAIQKTIKQAQAVRLAAKNTTTLFEGGGRSGKTFIILFMILVRCILFPGSRHLVARFRFSHAKRAICHDTMPKLLRILCLQKRVILNKSDWFYEIKFKNGEVSTIWVGGLDDKERLENLLGNEYATIFLNEASQISYEAYEILITRLNPPKGMKGKIWIDYNPPSMTHWGYLIFHKRQFPDGRPVPDNDFAVIKMNPKDNLDNISEEYLNNLYLLSEAKRRRFEDGEYSLEAGKLWKRAWIKYWPKLDNLPDFLRVVVGVDPSGSVAGDEVGIVVVGSFLDISGVTRYMVLDDYSLNGTPAEWAAEVAAAYERWMADCVVAEKNYGGDMVESTIRNAHKIINVKLVNSSRGKVVRAEPVSALYEHDEVVHRIPFTSMEDEMCTYDPEISASPNRMDANVFAFAELTGEGLSILDVI